MTVRWSKRKSGTVRTTIRVNYHVPQEMVEWIIENTAGGIRNQTEALKFIREHVGSLSDGWHTIAAQPRGYGEYDLMVCHSDESGELEGDGYYVYEGENVV